MKENSFKNKVKQELKRVREKKKEARTNKIWRKKIEKSLTIFRSKIIIFYLQYVVLINNQRKREKEKNERTTKYKK